MNMQNKDIKKLNAYYEKQAHEEAFEKALGWGCAIICGLIVIFIFIVGFCN